VRDELAGTRSPERVAVLRDVAGELVAQGRELLGRHLDGAPAASPAAAAAPAAAPPAAVAPTAPAPASAAAGAPAPAAPAPAGEPPADPDATQAVDLTRSQAASPG